MRSLVFAKLQARLFSPRERCARSPTLFPRCVVPQRTVPPRVASVIRLVVRPSLSDKYRPMRHASAFIEYFTIMPGVCQIYPSARRSSGRPEAETNRDVKAAIIVRRNVERCSKLAERAILDLRRLACVFSGTKLCATDTMHIVISNGPPKSAGDT